MNPTTPTSATPGAAVATGDGTLDSPSLNRHFECDDVDSHAQSMDGWSLHLDQLSPGPFRGEIHEIRVDGVQLVRERVNRALLKRGEVRERATSFSIPLEVEGAGYCGGAQLRDRVTLVSNSRSQPELRTPEQHDVAILTVPGDKLASFASPDGREDARATYLVTLGGAHYEALKAFLLASFEAADASTAAFAYPHARKALHDTLLLELAHIADPEKAPIRLDETARRRVVDRVRELVTSKPDVPFTVLDVCQAVGTSRRKLQYCFEEILGTHPAYYLRVLRLNAVRRELRRHSEGTATVSDLAFSWGFWHLSRFATHYRQLFGELPSQTLKRPPR
ncbi:helix-turn-helix domain-containing protein [Trinickia dinghuensis]|uniref:Helix-turn-helix domain-containing protein n=1 Tax=Trinickia dinghuensis TaxID=2291023 RepID=A0A3D8K1M9_9BURK|nr:helix-turn-helix domain-containing protein [Trinickia dinghuensis]RDU98816.1 helix-turn-helix domain-containing protein [Trinickia dinghuensis]